MVKHIELLSTLVSLATGIYCNNEKKEVQGRREEEKQARLEERESQAKKGPERKRLADNG